MCPVVFISCFQMMDAIILWSTFLPVRVIFPFRCRRFQMTSGGSLILFCCLFAVLCLLCLIVLLTAVIILCRHLFCPHRDSAACRKGPLAMAMASLSKTFSESRTRIIGWSVARSVLADDISQTLVKILPDRKLWKRLQRSKTWSALIFDDQLFSLPFAHSFNALAGLFETPHMNRDFNLQFFSNDDFQFAIDWR